MARRKLERNPLFAGRWFEYEIILLCLCWYFRFKLSYRDLVLILSERGLTIAHTTILKDEGATLLAKLTLAFRSAPKTS